MSPFENKYVIGLTGNIAVGKSVVRQMLQHFGAYTIDADGLTHQAMAPGAPAYQPIVEMFGKFIVDGEGRINRPLLGAVAFAVPEALVKLEEIIHPFVTQAMTALISRAQQRVIVVEAIKLLESDVASMCDTIWVVDATVETQVKRLMEKRKLPLEEARKRIIAQPPQSDKLSRAKVVIKNDGTVEDTWKQVQMIWNATVVPVVGNQMPKSVPTMGTQPAAAPARPAQPQPQAQPPARPAPSMPPQPARPAPTTNNVAARPVQAAPAMPPAPQQRTVPAKPAGTSSLTPKPNVVSPLSPKTEVGIRRGMPNNAEMIAKFVTRVTGNAVDRMDIMLAFGQKSFLLALGDNDAVIAVIGWTVENLITRIDEFYLDPNVPRDPVISALVIAVEEASRELQSEVSFIFLPKNVAQDVVQAFVVNGYQPLNLSQIKFPAWREAAHEMVTPDTVGLMKQLRADRIMKPI
ncbi:MAG: dephospho-CoA kinase [Chloroflexi bacterium]|uniref:dephospho-CoA kinase n=1 Tax=Candidatus Flexifilum breve TaxID=3140694 RepID=UPI003136E5E9|nr:dephospho-CoA kinase [Chloroflexota bacterium]